MSESERRPTLPSMGARMERVEDLVGASPDEVLGAPGRGVLGKLGELAGKVDDLAGKVDDLVEVMTRRRAVLLFVFKVAAVPVIGGAVAWVLHYLAGFHR